MREKGLKIIGRVVWDGKGGLTFTVAERTRRLTFSLARTYTLSEEELARRHHEPVLAISGSSWWLYRDVVVDARDVVQDELPLRIKHFVLRHENALSRIRHEVEAFENLDRLPAARRDAIPEAVRMFVWQRDEGKCVKCGSREKLEFDHIIPVADGGSNTERNVQLLCGACNRDAASRDSASGERSQH
jgi:hypothetical protein